LEHLLTNFHSIFKKKTFFLSEKISSFLDTLCIPSAAKSTTSNDISVRKPFSSNFILPVTPLASNLNIKLIK